MQEQKSLVPQQEQQQLQNKYPACESDSLGECDCEEANRRSKRGVRPSDDH